MASEIFRISTDPASEASTNRANPNAAISPKTPIPSEIQRYTLPAIAVPPLFACHASTVAGEKHTIQKPPSKIKNVQSSLAPYAGPKREFTQNALLKHAEQTMVNRKNRRSAIARLRKEKRLDAI
jgi:hypothetical protein